MEWPDLAELAKAHSAPVVTILASLDHRRPGSEEDRLRLRHLGDQAAAALREHGAGQELAPRVREAIGRIDLKHPTPGVAILVGPERELVLRLPVSVPEQVTVGEHFAMNDLIAARARLPEAYVLLLSRGPNRLVDVSDGEWSEHVGDGFPVEVEPPVETGTPRKDFPLAEHEHAEAARFVYRAVDAALDVVLREMSRPVVLVGTEREIAYFDEVAKHADAVVARVSRDASNDSVSQVEKVVGPALEQHRIQTARTVAEEAIEAIGTRAVGGRENVAAAAAEGRGYRLVVEEGLAGVDEVIETALTFGGRVRSVPSGALAACGGIALMLRY